MKRKEEQFKWYNNEEFAEEIILNKLRSLREQKNKDYYKEKLEQEYSIKQDK